MSDDVPLRGLMCPSPPRRPVATRGKLQLRPRQPAGAEATQQGQSLQHRNSSLRQRPNSFCNEENYCTMESVEVTDQELLIVLTVVGAVHEPYMAEISSPQGSQPAFRMQGYVPGHDANLFHDAVSGKSAEVFLTFHFPVELHQAEDVLFSYAPGYAAVSILEQLLRSLGASRSPPPSQFRLQWEECLGYKSRPSIPSADGDIPKTPHRAWEDPAERVCSSSPHLEQFGTAPGLLECRDVDLKQFTPSKAATAKEDQPEVEEDKLFLRGGQSAPSWSRKHLGRAGSRSPSASRRQRCQVLSPTTPNILAGDEDRYRKREDGFKQRSSPLRRDHSMRRTPLATSPSSRGLSGNGGISTGALGAARGEVLWSTIDAGHSKAMRLFERRLKAVRALQPAWASGDVAMLVSTLEASKDDSLTFATFRRLTQHQQPLPPRSLARMLPLAQSLAQSDSEDHAVTAMRFVLQSLKVSWPAVAKSLRSVATPKATYDACEEAAARLASLYSVVKAMARSVRIQRTSNGPLVPVCRKLKVGLEEALSAAGRLRGG
eukprot:TRINITY_DN64563_c0_g1_i1.p1 TRINITY_DN64563_c0_g1~~TRINITY_DN64563_c0_g1_i1.p1  ORF type:complete len:558 (+),score=105.54 TRINITY_DN64563_c0_g1_i1:38-1675(+)